MIFKKVILIFFSQLRSMYMVFMNIFSRRETMMYPETPVKLSNRNRGRIVLTRNSDGSERCVACNLCSVVCPVDCITLQKSENKSGRSYPKFFRINLSRCIFCGLCEESCPTLAIQLTKDCELSEFKREHLIYEKEDLLISGTGKKDNYNFYNVSGVSIEDKSIGDSKNEFKPISVKNLLP
ncbi:NADH-quinone oxidoreductase subunit I [Buchnera aphidicola (Tetraneura ulmi)]|uniref:NADH-quinone oxidoreductase subunit NuoI n=1 Tax=Buchnera aphidicola TaxID=9 RepID=UPI0034644A6B